jgi:hypothetical protein
MLGTFAVLTPEGRTLLGRVTRWQTLHRFLPRLEEGKGMGGAESGPMGEHSIQLWEDTR